ncbi:hypothetical protein BCIN_15g04020 [Botrytis cinerea B05.10]|uniref:Uncharacterized protein n=2 Tax=Botryotinia fuckeliana (strain B05.10) TaxID=332648 RepID=A0A384K4Y2_BOTFB|nr:hypothetical protein BCIN_15g04020 [Botrytis cinerea B05.10]ATZ57890.1 hypothetical protein BCIN_15g04020 [Botrytis cinerea B05.10]
MVISKLIEENPPDFLSSLLRGNTIQITYLKADTPITTHIPSIIGKAISARFKNLDKHSPNQACTVLDCLGEPQTEFEAKLFRSNVSDLMDHFGKWLYTGNVEIEGWMVWDLWMFGEAFGVPRYQNDIMRALCAKASENNPSLVIMKYFGFDAVTLNRCWDQTDFTIDRARMCSVENGSVYWGNKQMLKFIMDVIVFVGFKDSNVRRLINSGGRIAEQIFKLSVEVARGKTSMAAPWKSRNLKKYLVNEAILMEDSSSDEEIGNSSEEDTKDIEEDKENTADDDNDDDEENEDEDDNDNDDDEEMRDDFKEEEEESPFTAEELLAEGHRLAQPRHV